MAERARPPQRDPDQAQVNVHMPQGDKDRLMALCASADLDRSIVIRYVVREIFRAVDVTDNPLTLLSGVRRVVNQLVEDATEAMAA